MYELFLFFMVIGIGFFFTILYKIHIEKAMELPTKVLRNKINKPQAYAALFCLSLCWVIIVLSMVFEKMVNE